MAIHTGQLVRGGGGGENGNCSLTSYLHALVSATAAESL
jgi:hypothetical protein